MFGYVRPLLDQLSEEERRQYKSAYCGLCHVMGKRHGWIARFTLNYDFTLLALLHYACGGDSCTVCRRCPVHPFRKEMCSLSGTQLEAAADESIILTWHKLSDDVTDHSLIGGLPARFLRWIFLKGYRKAAVARPQFDCTVRSQMARLKELEREHSPKLDLVADTFAKILSGAAADCPTGDSEKRALEQLLYHLGRWIYLIDAWDDLEGDCRAGRYNPLDARFAGETANERVYVETTMTHSVRLIESAVNLLELGGLQSVIENVLFRGLPAVQKSVLDGNWKELRKQGRKTNERSV